MSDVDLIVQSLNVLMSTGVISQEWLKRVDKAVQLLRSQDEEIRRLMEEQSPADIQQTPVKVVWTDNRAYCGVCGKRVQVKYKPRYCSKCGQRLDTSGARYGNKID